MKIFFSTFLLFVVLQSTNSYPTFLLQKSESDKTESICVVESYLMSYYNNETEELIQHLKLQYEYDKAGKVIKITERNFDETENKWVFVYEMNLEYQSRSTYISYRQDSGINYDVKKDYDKQGRITRYSVSFDGKDKLDKGGKLFHYEDSILTNKTDCSFDKNGKCLKIKSETDFIYDELGRRTFDIRKRSNNRIDTVFYRYEGESTLPNFIKTKKQKYLLEYEGDTFKKFTNYVLDKKSGDYQLLYNKDFILDDQKQLKAKNVILTDRTTKDQVTYDDQGRVKERTTIGFSNGERNYLFKKVITDYNTCQNFEAPFEQSKAAMNPINSIINERIDYYREEVFLLSDENPEIFMKTEKQKMQYPVSIENYKSEDSITWKLINKEEFNFKTIEVKR